MIKEMTDKEFTDSLVRKVAGLELDLKLAKSDADKLKERVLELTAKMHNRALKVAARIHADFLDYEETEDADENYKLLMIAMRKQTHELSKAN